MKIIDRARYCRLEELANILKSKIHVIRQAQQQLHNQQILSNKLLASIFTNPKSGHLFAAGEQINTRNKLADTLRILANSSNPLEIFL
uniref:Uncharacterized protein n=1 Tax=Meloidogyne incognita TaxID=6306 RepID=A0A914MVW1_MELIC